MLIWETQIKKDYDIDTFSMVRNNKQRGFIYTETNNQRFINLVKTKIKNLYQRYFLDNTPFLGYSNRLDHFFPGDTGKPTARDKGGIDI